MGGYDVGVGVGGLRECPVGEDKNRRSHEVSSPSRVPCASVCLGLSAELFAFEIVENNEWPQLRARFGGLTGSPGRAYKDIKQLPDARCKVLRLFLHTRNRTRECMNAAYNSVRLLVWRHDVYLCGNVR